MPRTRPAAIVTQKIEPFGKSGRPYRELSGKFLTDLQTHWQEWGPRILNVVAMKYPELYFQGMIKLAQVHRFEVGQPNDFDGAKTREEVMERVNERFGPQGKVMFERFLKQLDSLGGDVIDG